MSRTKYGVSPWIERFPAGRRLEFPRFTPAAARRPSPAAVIIGGGLTGCMTAYALAASGVRVTLLEADRIGRLGSGRSPGILQGEAAASYQEIETRHGRRTARAMFEASRRAVLDLATTARRLGIQGIETGDALRVTSSYGADEKALAREVKMRRDAGLDAVVFKASVASREASIERLPTAVKLRDWGQADPVRLVMGFARAAADRGAALHERSAVRRINVTRRAIDVHAEGGLLTAETVIVCTGEPTDLYRSLKRHVRYAERFAVLTARLPAVVRKQIASRRRIVTDVETPPHFVRWTDDNRVLVAGADQARTPERMLDRVLIQRTGQLMYELSRMYPAISGIMPEYGWDVPIATTADGAMYAGPHRNYPRHLFAWATRHDPAQAFLASRLLLRHVTGAVEKDDMYFAFTRG
jgi:glycine/D-amino acid oxidase-like deaminating enzyme